MQDMQPQEPNLNPVEPMGAGQVDHEGAMAKADLYKLAQYSFKLFKKLEDNAQLESWVQAKITKAADYIASVYHYIEYEMEFSEYGKQIENSGMYSESQKAELKNKLMEAKEKVRSLKVAQADKMSEGVVKGGEKPCTECGGTGVMTVPDRPVPEATKEKVAKYNRLVKATKAAHKRMDANHNGIPDDEEVDEEVSSTGGTITRPKPGVTRHTHNPDRFSDEPHAEVPSKAKSKSAAEKSGEKAADKQTEKDSKDWQKRFGKDSVTKVSAGKKEGSGKKEKEVDETFGQGVYEGEMKVGATKKTRTGILTKTATGVKHTNTSFKDEEHAEPASKVKSRSAAEKAGDKAADKAAEKESKAYEKAHPGTVKRYKDGKLVKEAAPSAGMSKKEKSAVVKDAKAGKDIGKPGKSFDKVAKAAGGGEKGKKIAAAAMWKNAKKKVNESILAEAQDAQTEQILAQLAQSNPEGLQAAIQAGPEAVQQLVNDTMAGGQATMGAPTQAAAPATPATPAEPAQATAPATPATPATAPTQPEPVAESVRMREQMARLNRNENLQVNESAEVAQLRKLTKLLG
jgi:hypothetical protein